MRQVPSLKKQQPYLVFFRSKTRFHSVASIACFYVVVSNGNKYQVVRIILRPFQRSSCQLLSLLQFHLNQTFGDQMFVSHFRVFLVHQINPSTHTTRSSSWYFQPHPQDAQFRQQPEKNRKSRKHHSTLCGHCKGIGTMIYQAK